MFSKISRYRKLKEVITADSQGRLLPSLELRPFPTVQGKFKHTVEEIDRLDHLAYKYYKQPRKWWRICDANPDFMFPQNLLGKGSVVTDQFPIFVDEAEPPPWSTLRRALANLIGVEDTRLLTETEIVSRIEIIEGREVVLPTTVDTFTLTVTYNQMNLNVQDITQLALTKGYTMGPPKRVDRVGKKIVIPPNSTG